MKKILALLLALALCMTLFAACGTEIDNPDPEPGTEPAGPVDPNNPNPDTDSADNPENPDNPVDPDAPVDPATALANIDKTFIAENGLEYIWSQLNDDMKLNLAEVMNGFKNVAFSLRLTVGVPENEVKDFLNLVYSCCTDYIYVNNSGFVLMDRDEDGMCEVMSLPYNFEVAQYEADAIALKDELNVALDEFIKDLPKDKSEWDQIMWLYEKLVFDTTYSEDALLPFTAYGAIVEHKATCQGYADAMHLLLTRAGFEAAFVIGHGDSMEYTHKWNYVKLSDGKWYILDPTWADPAGKDDDYINYDYFLVDDPTLLLDHKEKFESIYYPAPVADSMELNYHRKMGYECSTYDEAYAAVEKQVKLCNENGKKYVYLRLTDDEVFTEVRQKLLTSSYGGEIKQILKDANKEGADFDTGKWGVYPKSDGISPRTIIVTLYRK